MHHVGSPKRVNGFGGLGCDDTSFLAKPPSWIAHAHVVALLVLPESVHGDQGHFRSLQEQIGARSLGVDRPSDLTHHPNLSGHASQMTMTPQIGGKYPACMNAPSANDSADPSINYRLVDPLNPV
ncbi:hypothetical protein QIS74_12332 [Colletotrichum tabaci]|uniref:Uncharacterized protein n=1 Tax=Colletotrichum tabaci TaxID=1209068 RepID=A0AAV9SXV4_9PEZI